jgi:exodeoxyribonuclease VII large subunit
MFGRAVAVVRPSEGAPAILGCVTRPPVGADQRAVITVSELSRRLRVALETATGRDWIQGEVGSVRQVASGHLYFTLKDEREEACIDCVAYRFHALKVRRLLADGARVQVFGRATLWAPRGRTQLIVEAVRAVGRGELMEQLQRLKEQLQQEGMFAPERKRPLPNNPRVIGVVTSSDGAAWHDIRTVAMRRGSVRLVLSPSLVQGDLAAGSIVNALDKLERYPGLEVIIVGRGGGSFEDLLAFSDERVVRRIAACRVPVVSAVGHEVDSSLSDWVADARAATPSEAAELVVADLGERQREFQAVRLALSRAMSRRLAEDRLQLQSVGSSLGDPRFVIADKQQWLDELRARAERQMRRRTSREAAAFRGLEQRLRQRHPQLVLARWAERLATLEARLERRIQSKRVVSKQHLDRLTTRLGGLSPLSILARGYSITLDERGRALRDAADVEQGAHLHVRLHTGALDVTVHAKDRKRI